MKQLRRAIAATATVAALAAPGPIALLSVSTAFAPAAYADTATDATDSQASPQASEGTDASPPPGPGLSSESPPPGEATPAEQVATDSASDPAATPSPSDSATTPAPSASPTSSARPSPSTLPSTDLGRPVPVPTGDPTPGQSQSSEPTEHSSEAIPGDGWSPSHCTDFIPDDSLSVDVAGLPSKIVAGSGWHPFTFSVVNHTGAALSNVYVQSFTEYATGVNERSSLQLDLAQLQFHDPSTGQWSDAFQDYYQDDTGRHPYSGTFVALVRNLARGERVDLHLRVRVVPTAPAGAGFALSTAVYAGQGSSCNINGDTYHFTVLKAGSNPGHVDDAQPTGEKPTDGARPQGGAQIYPVGGGLARTGTSEAVPVIGLIGALAVVVGAALVFGSRRRGIALAEAAEAAEIADGTAVVPAPLQPVTPSDDEDGAGDPDTTDGPPDPSTGTAAAQGADTATEANADADDTADSTDPQDAADGDTTAPANVATPESADGEDSGGTTTGSTAQASGSPAAENPATSEGPKAPSESEGTSGRSETT